MKNPDSSGQKRNKILLFAVYAAAGIVVTSVLGICLVINRSLSLVNYDTAAEETVTEAVTGPEASAPAETAPPETAYSSQSEILALETRLKDHMASAAQPLEYKDGVLNILLIGVDYENAASKGRSDSMILLSVNTECEQIVMTSFLRDIYLEIPGVQKANRLNAANVFGGPALLMETIERNFQIDVSKYVLTDFLSFVDIIDAVGGVRVDISEEELTVANGYIKGINWLLDEPIFGGMIEHAGEQELTGKQTLGYVRVRYVGNGDFDRTARQRYVLNQVYSKLKGKNVIELYGLLNTFLPELTTNLSKDELFSLILSLPRLSRYEIDSWSVPADGTYEYRNVRGMSVLGIDLAANTQALHEKIYPSDSQD